MNFARISEIFTRLPKQIKFIGIGSLVLVISTFLPWYADLDSYKSGDQFLGVTGPASLMGIVILVLAGFSFSLFIYHLIGRKTPRLHMREGVVHLAVSIEVILLLVLVNSIYFHQNFGVNITLKESRFGMTVAFIGAVLLFVGAYMLNKVELARSEGEGRLEPLIKLEKPVSLEPTIPPPVKHAFSEPQETRRHTPLMQYKASHKPPPRHEEPRSFSFGEKSLPAVQGQGITERREKDASSSGGGSYKLRMDL